MYHLIFTHKVMKLVPHKNYTYFFNLAKKTARIVNDLSRYPVVGLCIEDVILDTSFTLNAML